MKNIKELENANEFKEIVLANIDEEICKTEEIKHLASIISYAGDSAEANWFNVDGEEFGVSMDDEPVIMNSEGYPQDEAWLAENWELVEVLKAASRIDYKD